MPQFDTSTFSGQLFWLFLSLSVLYFYISSSFVPKIQEIMATRLEKTEGVLEKARLLGVETLDILAQRDEILKEARGKAEAILREAAQKVETSSKDRQLDIEGEFSDRVWEIESKIMEEGKELQKAIPELTLDISQKVIHFLIPRIETQDMVQDIVRSLVPLGRKAA